MIRLKSLAASVVLAAAGFVLTPSMASAATNLVTNGSFESPGMLGQFNELFAGDTSITGWTVGPYSIDYIGSYWTASDGNYSIDLNGEAPGSISQLVGGLTVGKTYNVTFDMAGNPDGNPTLKTLVADVTHPFSFSTVGHSDGSMGWTQQAFSFQATSTSELLSFVSTTTSNSGNGTYPFAFGPAIDNVSVTAVPEPAVWAMMLIGFGAIGFAMRGSRRALSAATA